MRRPGLLRTIDGSDSGIVVTSACEGVHVTWQIWRELQGGSQMALGCLKIVVSVLYFVAVCVAELVVLPDITTLLHIFTPWYCLLAEDPDIIHL